jgi:hypothetical protein
MKRSFRRTVEVGAEEATRKFLANSRAPTFLLPGAGATGSYVIEMAGAAAMTYGLLQIPLALSKQLFPFRHAVAFAAQPVRLKQLPCSPAASTSAAYRDF